MDEGTMQNLVDYAKSSQSLAQERNSVASMQRLTPILRFLDDFAAVLAYCLGANTTTTALVWGSIRLMLVLCPNSAQDTLQQILDMLEEISLSLPRFRHYEKTLPVDNSFERALLDVYTEMICFCARTIHFLRSNPHSLLRQNAWTDRRQDFDRTVKRIQRLSSRVEHEADLARMRTHEARYSEVLEVVKGLRKSKIEEKNVKRGQIYLPRTQSKHFCGRDEDLDTIRNAFALNGNHTSTTGPQVFALYGMGGVGKTQIALGFANKYRKTYDDIFWIAAESTTSIAQSCWEMLARLGSLHADLDEKSQDSTQAMIRFRDGLNQSGTLNLRPTIDEILLTALLQTANGF